MTKGKAKTRSLRVSIFVTLAFAILVALSLYIVFEAVAVAYIENIYLSEENRDKREKEYVDDLQRYIFDKGLTGENTEDFAAWAQSNRYLYLMIYKDDQLFFDSGSYEEPPRAEKPDDDSPASGDGEDEVTPPTGGDDTDADNPGSGENSGTEPPTGGGSSDEEDTPGDGTEPPSGEGSEDENGGADTPDTEGGSDLENGGTGSENGGSTKPDDDKEQGGSKPGSGITIRFPTREELMKYAEENDAHIVNTADEKVLVVNMADFTEYFYYDIINIAAIVIAMLAIFVIILIHYHGVTTRISRLAADVRVVASGDMEHKIGARGRDEISELSTNVEDMRSSILENIEKERAIMEANAELITSMSHDIRTPLTVLLGYIDIMKEKVGEDGEMAEYVEASEKTALRLKKLSDDLFNYFLLFGSGASDAVFEEYDVEMLLEQMLSEHVLLLRESGYDVKVELCDTLLGRRISTAPADLVRIFENVFSNIYKYADKTAPVLISADIIDGKLKLLFTNTISKVQHAESNGIGLKSCKKLAERLMADIAWEEREDAFTLSLSFDIAGGK